MREEIEILNVFHDGSIEEFDGALPSISLRIRIEYLREMFPTLGHSFWAHLQGCSTLEYLDWDSDKRTSDLHEILSFEPEILSVDQSGQAAHIICVEGELVLEFTAIHFKLDSGEEVSILELQDACTRYWDDWAKHNQTANNESRKPIPKFVRKLWAKIRRFLL